MLTIKDTQMGIRKWRSACQNLENEVENLIKKFSLPKPAAQFLVARHIKEDGINDFLNPKLASLSDPYRFPGIDKAADRLWNAIRNREPILIHGDYDTDGITATALLSLVLKKNGADVYSFIPHRFDDGYGFTPDSLHKAFAAHDRDFKVLVTVDCGITSNDAVLEARKMGIDTIITDHHETAQELPDAFAIINPKIQPELEDLQVLSGAGIAFKLSHAFIKYGREHNLGGFSTRLDEVLDYVALGTVADIVPLLGENRIMVKYGIEVLRKQFRPGIRALIETSRLQGELTPSDITFKLAPRINAAGRVGDAGIALQLLESENIVDAYRYASVLEKYNSIRQEKEQEIFQEAKEQIEQSPDLAERYSLLVAGREWHQGVIGIVASRLARDYNRPAIVLTIQNEHAYGSGRSVGSLNLIDILGKVSPLLERYGGHPMAVGVGLLSEKITELSSALEKHIRAVMNPDDLLEVTEYDGEIELEDLSPKFFEMLPQLAPFGHSNPKPLFRLTGLETIRTMPIGDRHTRGVLQSRRGNCIDFIAFNRKPVDFQCAALDLLCIPQINDYYQTRKPQLQIIDFAPLV